MRSRLQFRHRIGLLVSLAALALIAVAAVTLISGRENESALSGIETRYVPLIELDRDLKAIFEKIPRALEDAAGAAEPTKLDEADGLEADLLKRIAAGASTIRDNGGDPDKLQDELRTYYKAARDVSSALMSAAPTAELAPTIEAMHRSQQAFAQHLDQATSPDRRRLAASFAEARATQTRSLWIDIGLASAALGLMALVSWQLIRRTVGALHAVSDGVERIARGDFGSAIDVPPGDEFGDLAREANRTAGRLREYREQSEREDWIKTGLAALNDQIAGDLDDVTVAARAMKQLVEYTGAREAAIYGRDERGAFRRLVASPGDGKDELGDKPLDENTTDRTVRIDPIASGFCATVPLLHEARTMGALEIAFTQRPHDRTVELLARSRGVIGTAFRVAESRGRERELLLETRRQATAAQASAKELEAFSYSVSHDLRAPLRGIDGFSQALLEDCGEQLPEEGQGYLRRIRAAAQRMAELIDDLLRLSRVTRAEFRRERVDLSTIVNTVVSDLRRANGERAVNVQIQGAVEAYADPRLLRITFENLLGNAWKFTSKTESPVIEFGSREENGERVYFVRDNGAGFDMQYAERLFGAFQRLHSDKDFPGTGIGLATVQRIILRHGGRIWVDAAVGRGATFLFTLPTATSGVNAS